MRQAFLFVILLVSASFVGCVEIGDSDDATVIEESDDTTKNQDNGTNNTVDNTNNTEEKEVVKGCMNSTANNYNAEATEEDNTCVFAFKPQTKDELQTAVDMWIEYNDNANSTYGEINTWDTSLITDMSYLFMDKAFNDDISNWDVSSVTNMGDMFFGSGFNNDISGWDVSNVTNMHGMFDTSEFNGDISNWDVSNVTKMGDMFARTPFNQDLSDWDVSSVTNMAYMFHLAGSFNQDISSWDVSSVTFGLHNMFNDNDLSDENKCAIHTEFSSNDNWPYDWDDYCD